MKLIRTALYTAVVGLAVADLAVAQQTITFSGPTPPVAVTLTPGSNIDISTNGNVTAACVPGSGQFADRCQGMPTTGTGGGGGNPPTVSIGTGSNFSNPPNGQGQYPDGTSFTITPVVSSNAEVCIRRNVSGQLASAGWAGVFQPPFNAVSVSMPSIGTYGYEMRCFADGGAATSTQINLTTFDDGGGGGGVDCTGIGPPSGYNRWTAYDQFTDLPSVNFFGQFIDDFPSTGSDQGRLVFPPGNYVSIQFTAPAAGAPEWPNPNQGVFNFTESQVGGDANLNSTYITISQCQGDFRIPPNNNAAPTTDQTFANGCRNIDFATSPPVTPSQILRRIDFRTGLTTSSSSLCQITPGQTYYFNMILADPRGTITAGENTCSNQTAAGCGIQMNIE